VTAILIAGSVIARVIDLDTQAHPQKSLTGILIVDVLWSIVMLLVFSLSFGLFCYRVGVWDRILRKPPDRT
jgi:hypothetical protein